MAKTIVIFSDPTEARTLYHDPAALAAPRKPASAVGAPEAGRLRTAWRERDPI